MSLYNFYGIRLIYELLSNLDSKRSKKRLDNLLCYILLNNSNIIDSVDLYLNKIYNISLNNLIRFELSRIKILHFNLLKIVVLKHNNDILLLKYNCLDDGFIIFRDDRFINQILQFQSEIEIQS